MKILFLTNVPSPYRVDFFNELGKQSELTVLFEKSTSDERDSSWKEHHFVNFNGIVLAGLSTSTDSAICPSVIAYIKKYQNDCIIVADTPTPTGMLAIQYMKLKKITYFIEGDGGFAKSGKGFVESIKKHFIKGADGYFSTSESLDNYYIMYGAQRRALHRYPFTSLCADDILGAPYSLTEKTALRNELGIQEKRIIVAVGQFIYRKGFDVLLLACQSLSKETGIYFVGGEATEEYLDLKEKYGVYNVHFVGFKRKTDLRKYYLAADMCVLPTREDAWGLVINEAMACGLPVITTERCVAGLELVTNGENGYIVPVGNAELLAEKINCILDDNELCQHMGEQSLKKISAYTIENMAKSHMAVLQQKCGE